MAQPVPGAIAKSGNWTLGREVKPFIHQTQSAGPTLLLVGEDAPPEGVWRAIIQPSLGTAETGIWIGATDDPACGIRATLGPTGDAGLGLSMPDGARLWEDKWVPWQAYQTCILECIVEASRARVQMFDAAGVLQSQGPWVDLPEDTFAQAGRLALYTRDGQARFWQFGRAETPLSPIIPDAPNKRRLVQDDTSPWQIVGPGSWTWTTAERTRIRQQAVIERSSAIHTGIRGPRDTWECRVSVDPGAGGAGMLFQCSPDAEQGFLAWLGGAHGAGGLMLYRLPLQALWGGPQGAWTYDTPLVLRAESADGKLRVTMLKDDGESIIQQSPWIAVRPEEAEGQGAMGFMTWLGTAEFWGFSEATAGGGEAPAQIASTASLGESWIAIGDGDWVLAENSLTQSAVPERAIALNTAIKGIMGTWRCRVTPTRDATAGVVFQSSRDATKGFACAIGPTGARLISLDGRTMWEDGGVQFEPGTTYTLEGVVDVDRVAARVLAAAGTVLTRSPDVYVSDTNNHREGHLGVLCRGAAATFAAWEHE